MEITALGKIQNIRRRMHHAVSIFRRVGNMPAIEIWLFASFNLSQPAIAIMLLKGK